MASPNREWVSIGDSTFARSVPGGVLVRHVYEIKTPLRDGLSQTTGFTETMVFLPGVRVEQEALGWELARDE
jgi:hypothetical protein